MLQNLNDQKINLLLISILRTIFPSFYVHKTIELIIIEVSNLIMRLLLNCSKYNDPMR